MPWIRSCTCHALPGHRSCHETGPVQGPVSATVPGPQGRRPRNQFRNQDVTVSSDWWIFCTSGTRVQGISPQRCRGKGKPNILVSPTRHPSTRRKLQPFRSLMAAEPCALLSRLGVVSVHDGLKPQVTGNWSSFAGNELLRCLRTTMTRRLGASRLRLPKVFVLLVTDVRQETDTNTVSAQNPRVLVSNLTTWPEQARAARWAQTGTRGTGGTMPLSPSQNVTIQACCSVVHDDTT